MAKPVPEFRDTAHLREWLVARGVPMKDYDTGRAKPLTTLLSELADGESRLAMEHGVLMRLVEVVTLRVTHGDLILVEVRQVHADGREWTRDSHGGYSVSEKMHRGESPTEACSRGLSEELGLAPGDFSLLGEHRTDTNERTSAAFPGLRGRYLLHRMAAEVLPSGFRPEGYVEEQDDKSTYFEWRAR